MKELKKQIKKHVNSSLLGDKLLEDTHRQIQEVKARLNKTEKDHLEYVLNSIAKIEYDYILEQDTKERQKLRQAIQYNTYALLINIEGAISADAAVLINRVGYVLGIVLYIAGKIALKSFIGL